MIIHTKTRDLNLGSSSLFRNHYADRSSCAEIILQQVNSGHFDKYLSGNGIALDIGANVGIVSLYLRSIYNEVHSFEPTPSHCAIFKDLIDKLSISGIVLNESAVSAITGEAAFSIDSQNSTMNSLSSDSKHSNQITVKTQNIVDYCESRNITKVDIAKIDIEGGELNLINSFDSRLFNICDSLLVETHIGVGVDRNIIAEHLSKLGYKIELFSSDGIFAHK